MPIKPPLDDNSRESASAVDADSSVQADNSAQAESDRIDTWTKKNFTPSRAQAQLDPSYGYSEKRTGK